MARILVVDDNISIVNMMQDLLHIQGHKTYTAYDGSAAAEKALELLPDLILLDVEMPGMDGISVCRNLREHKATRLIPIVILTGKTDTRTLMSAIKAGADDFLTKPADLPILKARVDSLLRMSHIRNQLAEKQKFETTINHLQNGIIITNQDGMIQNYNKAARQMFSLSDDKVESEPFLYSINQGFKTKTTSWDELTAKQQDSFLIYRIENDFKLRYALEIKYNVIRNSLGEIDEVVFVANEETDRINEDRRKDLFITMLKHKFSTVETITQLSLESLEIILQSKDPALETVAIDGLKRASGNLSDIMRKLIKYVRMPEELNLVNKTMINQEWFASTTENIVETLQLATGTVQVEWQDINEFPMLEDGMFSILFELIENALKFGDPEQPRISITIGKSAGQIVLAVSNSGPQIPQEELNRIWDRFYQVDQDITGQVKGIGLGMSIVKYILNLVGGNGEIVSGSEGTTVKIYLPAAVD